MESVLILMTVQGALGAFDTVWNHEWRERLPARPQAATELALHAAREYAYVVVFLVLGWLSLQGLFAAAFAVLLVIEVVITLWDFVVEDRTRKLSAVERVTHTLLALNYGGVLALLLPALLAAAAQPSGLRLVDHGVWSVVMTVYALGALLWAVRDGRAAGAMRDLRTPSWVRNPIRVAPNADPMTVLVTGGTGFIGTALCRRLIGSGHDVWVLGRDRAKIRDRFGESARALVSLDEIENDQRLDAIVNLAGPPLVGGRWTRRRKAHLLGSRLGVTRQVVALIGRLARKPQVLVSGSAIGYYGCRGDETVTETDGPQNIFMSELCRAWEDEAGRARRFGVRVVALRTGVVLGTSGGMLAALLMPFRLGLGALFGTGRQWFSWVHLDDLVSLILHAILSRGLDGPINAAAPRPVTARTFAKALAAAVGRPQWLRVPAWPLRAALGELSDLFVRGQRVLPQRALESGFRFRYPALPHALAEIVGQADDVARALPRATATGAEP